MADPLYRQLARQARRLARLDPRRPQQGNLRRSVSSAYYSLFHYLVYQSCRSLLGTAHDRRPYREAIARAFEHRTMSRACKSFAATVLPAGIQKCLPSTFHIAPELQSVAAKFVEAQEVRHSADYDLSERYTREDVLVFVRDIEHAIQILEGIRNSPEARFFLACLLAWGSMGNR